VSPQNEAALSNRAPVLYELHGGIYCNTMKLQAASYNPNDELAAFQVETVCRTFHSGPALQFFRA
jgi:hypothetical protein